MDFHEILGTGSFTSRDDKLASSATKITNPGNDLVPDRVSRHR